MKKKSIKSLSLNKKSISNLGSEFMGGQLQVTDNSIQISCYKSCVNYTKVAGGCPPPPPPQTQTYCGWDCLNIGSQHINCQ